MLELKGIVCPVPNPDVQVHVPPFPFPCGLADNDVHGLLENLLERNLTHGMEIDDMLMFSLCQAVDQYERTTSNLLEGTDMLLSLSVRLERVATGLPSADY